MDKKIRIIVVEDEALVAEDIRQTLLELGYEVPEVFFSGEEAAAGIPILQPDLVIMDILLSGGLDGVEVIEQVRCHGPVPVIYLSANMDGPTLDRARMTAPLGFITKPFSLAQLRTTLDAVMSGPAVATEGI